MPKYKFGDCDRSELIELLCGSKLTLESLATACESSTGHRYVLSYLQWSTESDYHDQLLAELDSRGEIQ